MNETKPDRSDFSPFRNVRVLDLSLGMAGPNCGGQFAQMGADVIKVESPEGDWVRYLGKRYGDNSALSLVCNRGKRSLAVDLKNPKTTGLLLKIAARSDVVIESFRPGVAERLGLGYEQVRAVNPDIIYVSISGFGQTGPYSRLPCTDTVAQAFSGMMGHTPDRDGKPLKIGFLVVDAVASLYAFQAAAAALYARTQGAGGRHLDISLMQATAAVQAPKVAEAAIEGESDGALNVPAGTYRTSDGWIAVTLNTNESFAAICRVLGRDDLATDPRFTTFATRRDNAGTLIPLLEEIIATRPSAHWLTAFQKENVLSSRVNTITDWLANSHVRETRSAPTVDQPGIGPVALPLLPGLSPESPGATMTAPSVGAHNAEILTEAGLDPKEIAALEQAGIFRMKTPQRGA